MKNQPENESYFFSFAAKNTGYKALSPLKSKLYY